MDKILITNQKSLYLKALAVDFDNKTKPRENLVNFTYPINSHAGSKNKNNTAYYSGVAATVAQAAAGICLIGAAIKSKNGKNNTFLSDKLNHLGWISVGFSYLVSIPSCLGASLKAAQPGMLLGTTLWGLLSPLMMMKRFDDSARLKGAINIGTALVYSGLANKIKNDNELKPGEKSREFDFKGNKDNLFVKTAKLVKFSIKDHLLLPEALKNAFVQTKDYIFGTRKELPDCFSAKPSSDNRRLTSLLLYAGGIPLMLLGKKNKAAEKAANILIGTGLLIDSLGMIALGNAEKGTTKAVLLAGVPLRAIGDFAQTNKFMYGLRTLGGSSFEYYFAAMNQDKESKTPKADSKS